MTDSILKESATLAVADKNTQKAHATLITEGQGSSGHYSAEVLKEHGPKAFPKGTQVFYNHKTESDVWERSGSRDITELIGVTITESVWEESTKSLTADIEFFSNARQFVSEAMPYVGLSVEASGVISDDGIIEAIIPHPNNCVALVPNAGRGGKIESLFESFRDTHGKLNPDDVDTGKDEGMKPEDITAVTEAVKAALEPLFESLKPAEPETPSETEGEDTATVAEAVASADLPKSARSRVYESVSAGTPVAEAIKAEQEYIAELQESAAQTQDTGRVREAGKANDFDGTVGLWG